MMLIQQGCEYDYTLWKMFREGVVFCHGFYMNLDTMRVNPISV